MSSREYPRIRPHNGWSSISLNYNLLQKGSCTPVLWILLLHGSCVSSLVQVRLGFSRLEFINGIFHGYILNGMWCVGITRLTCRGRNGVYHKLPKLPFLRINSGAETTYTRCLTIEVVWIILYVLLVISPASNCSWPTFRNPVSVPSSKTGCRVYSTPSLWRWNWHRVPKRQWRN